MKVSIIVPVFNNAEFVEAALESVQRQALADFELIVINDGSTDASAEIIDRFAASHSNVTVIHQVNQGVSAARNAGLDIASGEYIAFIDGDDEYEDGVLSDMVLVADKWQADMVVGVSQTVGTFRTRTVQPSEQMSQRVFVPNDDFSMIYNFSVCNKMFRRSVIEAHGLRFQPIKHAEDGLFLFSFLNVCGRITGCPKEMYRYYKRISLVTTSALKSLNMSMFEDAMYAAESIAALTSSYSEAYREEFNKRILRVTIIGEYYRRMWTMDDPTLDAIIAKANEYRAKLSDEAWEEINEVLDDLECLDGLHTKNEILASPQVSVLIPYGLSLDDYHAALNTLYFQICPSFEVIVDARYQADTEAVYAQKENLFFCQTGENEWKDLFESSRGRSIQVIGESCIYNEDSLKLMIRRLRTSKSDFVSIQPMYYHDGVVDENSRVDGVFRNKKRLKDAVRLEYNQLDSLCSNKLFRRDCFEELVSIEAADQQERIQNAFRRFLYKRYCTAVIGTRVQLPTDDVQDTAAKKHPTTGLERAKRVLYTLARTFTPIQKKQVLFLSDIRGELGGNYEPLYGELKKRGYRVICDFKPSKAYNEGRNRKLKRMIDMARSEYVVLEDFHADTTFMKVRRGQELVQLWHAAGAYKKFAWSRAEGSEDINIHTGYKKYTKAIVSSESIRKDYADAFQIAEDAVVATGIPRTDIFFNQKHVNSVRKKYDRAYPMLKGKKILLIAPTYRGTSQNKAMYDFDMIDPERIHNAMGDEYVIVFKWHPATYSYLLKQKESAYDFSKCGDYAIDLSKERDINELMMIADLLVTDYSSVIFEYLLVNKPIVYYWYDINEWILGRGTYYEPEEYVYGRVAYDQDALIEALAQPEMCEEERAVFRNKFMSACDGRATKRVADRIFDRK